MNHFADKVLSWYDQHGRRDLPWQQGDDPYRVWISEIMLQQTQVQTVIPYYERFMQRFGDVNGLADASVDEVLQHWSGLGYYARARNLHRAAQRVRDEFAGELPGTFDELVALPGIGRSTAGAILALAHNQRHAILDGNVKRVLARHAAIAGWPGKSAVAGALWQLAEDLTPMRRVGAYTQAIMDLGATVCTRTKPDCAACPVGDDCQARLADAIAQYPGRKPRKIKPLKRTTMVIAVNDDAVYLERRPAAGIWGGLWSLPEVTNDEGDARDVIDWCRQVLNCHGNGVETWDILRHSFSHYDLEISPVVVRVVGTSGTVANRVSDGDNAAWYRPGDNPPGGIAAPVQKLISELKSQRHVTNC